jgi:hypothetical protein
LVEYLFFLLSSLFLKGNSTVSTSHDISRRSLVKAGAAATAVFTGLMISFENVLPFTFHPLTSAQLSKIAPS